MKDIILLVLLFSTSENVVPHTGEAYGYGPREIKSLELCEKRKEYLEHYIGKQIAHGSKFTVFCMKIQFVGFDKALENFRRSLGDPL